ncbi:hypothetical protein FGO68_gene11722 [Halteria grandinella]|uniref:Uncharacterized protein n=1 Tax=Halteria grandinella TaxID=5974 RepID=A0A8J8NBE2_HALGN|nr:hypothetical protein FGO68_gene11722 [Halteria grandinella]
MAQKMIMCRVRDRIDVGECFSKRRSHLGPTYRIMFDKIICVKGEDDMHLGTASMHGFNKQEISTTGRRNVSICALSASFICYQSVNLV